MSANIKSSYDRKEWMHPEDLDLEKPSNHVLYLKHLKAYEHALQYVKGKTVLEVGCGSGYGNKLLSQQASHIYSVDIDKESLDFAREHNPSQNISYLHANVVNGIELEDESCDICVCYQVIEHIEKGDLSDFLNEISRIVKRNGSIFFSTPNRKTRLYPFQKPVNKYHTTEYTGKQLKKLLSHTFEEVEIFGLQATEQLKLIEINRSRRSLFKFFILRPVKSLLKVFGINGPLFKSNGSNSQQMDNQKNLDFDTNNFWFDKNVPDDSIDLLAHCINK